MTVVTPAGATKPVPVMMMFGGRSGMPPAPGTPPPAARGFGPGRGAPPNPATPADPPATEQLIADGWGYATINPGSIQADNGAGLTAGIIGLVNKGQPRKPDDWGSLRAWAWGASRGLDYLETDKAVDAKKVGIEGVSRYGKAALVTMAFDQRFALVLVGSSGEGGAKLHRRNFGEAVENLTGSGEYHWMAGNFLKYGAAESTFGSKNAGDIPVDAHQLIALCAPRLTFISYGVPERGDAKWLDQQGSYMAAVAAQPGVPPARREGPGRLGRLHEGEDAGGERQHARRPARLAPARRRAHRRPELEVLHPVGGQVPQAYAAGAGATTGSAATIDDARRRTAGDRPGLRHDGCRGVAPVRSGAGAGGHQLRQRQPALPIGPAPRTDQNSLTAHAQLLEKARAGRIDVYFVGDSITRRWGATDYPELLANWTSELLRLERRQLRLGRRPDPEHPLAPRQRRARRRQSQGDRDPGGHQQRRVAAWRRQTRSPRSRAA